MSGQRAYTVVLRLYPADFRAMFAAEMLRTFDEAGEAQRRCGRLAFVRFTFVELLNVVVAAAAEWVAKCRSHPSARGRCLPDWRMMRPADVGKREWFGP